MLRVIKLNMIYIKWILKIGEIVEVCLNYRQKLMIQFQLESFIKLEAETYLQVNIIYLTYMMQIYKNYQKWDLMKNYKAFLKVKVKKYQMVHKNLRGILKDNNI